MTASICTLMGVVSSGSKVSRIFSIMSADLSVTQFLLLSMSTSYGLSRCQTTMSRRSCLAQLYFQPLCPLIICISGFQSPSFFVCLHIHSPLAIFPIYDMVVETFGFRWVLHVFGMKDDQADDVLGQRFVGFIFDEKGYSNMKLAFVLGESPVVELDCHVGR